MYKILSTLLTLSICTLFVACSEDDEVRTVATEADLVGTWTIHSSEVDFEINGQDMIDYFVETYEMSQDEAIIAKKTFESEAEMESGTIIELKSNHTYVATATGEDPDNGTWKLSTDGKKLMIDEGTIDAMEFEFKSIASKNLSLFTERSDNMDIDGDEIDETLEAKMTLNLTK